MSEGREPRRPALARAQNAGSEFSGVATDRLARTTRDMLNAVSFPRFVTELITGVFKAMNDSNQQQLTAFVELIRNVAQTTEGFADANVGIAGARQWLAEHFPGLVRGPGRRRGRVRRGPVRSRAGGASPARGRDPGRARCRHAAGASPRRQPADRGRAAHFARRSGRRTGLRVRSRSPGAARPRRCSPATASRLLSTMVQMGLQRIVIESGRLNASMRFHIDTSSAASDDRGSQFDMRNTAEVSGGASFGPWGDGGEGPEHDRLRLHPAHPDDRGDQHRARSRQQRRADLPHRLCPARPAGRGRGGGPDPRQFDQPRGRSDPGRPGAKRSRDGAGERALGPIDPPRHRPAHAAAAAAADPSRHGAGPGSCGRTGRLRDREPHRHYWRDRHGGQRHGHYGHGRYGHGRHGHGGTGTEVRAREARAREARAREARAREARAREARAREARAREARAQEARAREARAREAGHRRHGKGTGTGGTGTGGTGTGGTGTGGTGTAGTSTGGTGTGSTGTGGTGTGTTGTRTTGGGTTGTGTSGSTTGGGGTSGGGTTAGGTR